MLSKLGEPSIDPNAPWADDVLNRKTFGQTLATMIRSLSQPFVISLKGDWGSGKSVFLRRLRLYLEQAPGAVPVIHVDAWRSDHYEDPIYALISAIEKRIETHRAVGDLASERAARITQDLFGSAAKVVAPLMRIAGAVVDMGTGGAAGNLIGGLGDLGAALREANEQKRDAQAEFQDAIRRARDELLGRDAQDVSGPFADRKIVVVIDELDRCRPDYAIKLLERIKHLFEIPGIVFIIAVDGKNLHHAVNTLYGPAIDSEVYLRKFFDIEMYLPRPSTSGFNSILRQAFQVGLDTEYESADWEAVQQNLFSSRFNPSAHPKSAMVEASAYFEVIAEAYRMGLRDQAQAFSRLHACVAAAGNDRSFFPFAAALLVCLRYHRPSVYEAWRTTLASPSLLLQENSELVNSVKTVNLHAGRVINAYLEICGAKTPEQVSQFWSGRSEEDREAYHTLLRRLPENSRSALRVIRQSYQGVFAVSGMMEEQS